MTRRTALAVIAVALVAKLALLALLAQARPGALTYTDTVGYLDPARALLKLGVFAPDVARSSEPELVRTPGYPLVAALSLALFGERTWPLSVLGILASAGTALVLLTWFTPPLPQRVACWAAVLVSVDAGSFLRSLDVLTESLFTLLLVLVLGAYLRASTSGSTAAAGLAGVGLGVATLVRPIAVYLGPVAVLGLVAAFAARRVPPGRAVRAIAAFALPVLALVGGWILRNHRVAGLNALAPVAGHQLLHRRAASVVAWTEGISLLDAQEELGIREAFLRIRGPAAEKDLFGDRRYADAFPETSRLSLPELDRRWQRQAFGILAAHPLLSLRMLGEGVAQLLFAPPPLILFTRYGLYSPGPELIRAWANQRIGTLVSLFARQHPIVLSVALATLAQLVIFWGLALAGIALAIRRRALDLSATVILGGTLLYLVAVSAGTDASDDRFRVPLVPLASVFAAAALVEAVPVRPR